MNVFAGTIVALCLVTVMATGYAALTDTSTVVSENAIAENSMGILVSDSETGFNEVDSPQAQGLFTLSVKQSDVIQFKPVFLKVSLASTAPVPPEGQFLLTVSSAELPNLRFGSVSLCGDGPEVSVPVEPGTVNTVRIGSNDVYKVILETPMEMAEGQSVDFTVRFSADSVAEGGSP